MSFFDPHLTSDGKKVYKRERYKVVVGDELYISKQTGTGYSEIELMTPYERDMWVNLLKECNQESSDKLKEEIAKIQQSRK